MEIFALAISLTTAFLLKNLILSNNQYIRTANIIYGYAFNWSVILDATIIYVVITSILEYFIIITHFKNAKDKILIILLNIIIPFASPNIIATFITDRLAYIFYPITISVFVILILLKVIFVYKHFSSQKEDESVNKNIIKD